MQLKLRMFAVFEQRDYLRIPSNIVASANPTTFLSCLLCAFPRNVQEENFTQHLARRDFVDGTQWLAFSCQPLKCFPTSSLTESRWDLGRVDRSFFLPLCLHLPEARHCGQSVNGAELRPKWSWPTLANRILANPLLLLLFGTRLNVCVCTLHIMRTCKLKS